MNLRIRQTKVRIPFRQNLARGFLCLLVAIGASLSTGIVSVLAQSTSAPELDLRRSLILEDIQLEGATRTPLSTVYKYLPLRPGQPIDQQVLIDGVSELREGGLFKSVEYYTKPGTERGRLILVLEVKEQGLDLRFGTGNTDLDGWYLVPAMIAWDNQLGHGSRLDLQWRIGFRTNGLLLTYARPRIADGRSYWGSRLYTIATDRPYFSDGTEFRHNVNRSGLEGVFGRRVTGRTIGEIGLTLESVDSASTSTAHHGSPDGTISEGQKIPTEDLPAPIQEAVGTVDRVIATVDYQLDTRNRSKRAGSPISGLWGRIKGQAYLQEDRSFVTLQGDLRLYQEVPGGVLAARLRGQVVGDQALFYDRYFLGGMYTVRGFPTNSLSAAGGDTWLFSGSMEYRSRIIGDQKGTRLAGLFFLDAGAAGSAEEDVYPGMAVGAGYGIRWKVWWLDWIGVDVGFPLTTRPVDQRFQVNASIGWSF